MKFRKLSLDGAWLIEPDLHLDVRGYFGRTFCVNEFAERGLDTDVAQCSLSFNRHTGTLRGIHYQSAPLAETKLVRVQHGAIWDVIVDLRVGSPTFASWCCATLTAENAQALYVPKGFGHAFITLTDDTEVFYQMSVCHAPHMARGIIWDDSQICIKWPLQPTVISEKDRTHPLLQEAMTSLSPLAPT